jgi:hypothetical protein
MQKACHILHFQFVLADPEGESFKYTLWQDDMLAKRKEKELQCG